MKANEERWLVKRINLARLTRFGHSPAIQVYAYLIGRCDVEGVCFPSFNTIAQQTGLSLRTVYRVMQVLERISALKKRQVIGHLHKYDFVINLDLLGIDMRRAYLSEWAQCQGKVCRKLPEVCVSETQNSVSETQNCVSETNPPHPLIGVRTMEGPKKLFADLPPAKDRVPSQTPGGLLGKMFQALKDDAKSRGQLLVMSPRAWKELKNLNEAASGLDEPRFCRWLTYRAQSEVNLAERPEKFISTLPDYEFGPLDRWGKPKGETNATSQNYRSGHGYSKSDRADEELAKAGVQRPSRQAEAGIEPHGVVPGGRDGCGSPGVVLEGNRFFVQ